MVNLSSAMGSRFAEFTSEFAGAIQLLGPNPLRENGKQDDSELKQEIEKIGGLMP